MGAKRAEKRNLIHEAFNAKLKQGEEPFDLQRLKNMRVRMLTRVSTGVRDYRYVCRKSLSRLRGGTV